MMFRKKLSPSLISLSSSLLLSVAVQADESNTQQNAVNQGLTVVTANRSAMSVDETLASVTVITREDIERSQIRSTEELLRVFANATVKNTGGRGKQTSLFLRGSESNHTLFLVDGVKVGSATSGATAFQNIQVDQIERIEVVRGPRSSMYGSEASGGVIQIFTRKEIEQGFKPYVRLGAGSDDTNELSVGFGVRNDHASVNATYSYEETDGFDSLRGYESDDDGFENSSLTVNSELKLSQETVLSFNYLQSHGQNEFDDSFGFYSNQENKDTLRVAGVRLNSQVTDRWMTDVQFGRSWDKSRTYADDQLNSTFETRRDSFSWLNQYRMTNETQALLGYDYQEDHTATSADFVQNERFNHGVFLQLQTHSNGHDAEASVRYDDNEQFGSEVTGSLAWGYGFSNGTRLRASYGTAFVAPSFNELYHPGFGFCCSGNPDLEPEQTETYEIGVSGNIEVFDWSVVWFRTEIDDLIVSEAPMYVPENVAEARLQGVELSARTVFFDWDIRSDLTLLSAKSRSGEFEGNRLINRPTQTLSVMMDRRFNRLSAGATLVAENHSYMDQQNTNELPGYARVDLRVGYILVDGLLLQGKVENLFEKDYELIERYQQPGLTYLVSLTYQP